MDKKMDKELDKKITRFLEENKEAFIADLRGLLKYDSVSRKSEGGKPFGTENAKALDYMMELCKKAGLHCENIDYYAMDATLGDGGECVASLSHLDIVPVGGGWEHEPLAGEMDGDIIYGRGTIDDKGPSIAALYSVKALIAAGVPLKRKVRLIFGCDEETGMSDMKYYITKREAPEYAFSPDAYFPSIHAEKSVIVGKYTAQISGSTILESIEGGTRSNVVPDKAKAYITSLGPYHCDPNIVIEDCGGKYEIRSRGISAHASTPEEGENAIVTLVRYLSRILPENDAYKPVMRRIYRAFELADGSGMGVECSDKPTGSLTLNLGVIAGDSKKIDITFDIRNPVTYSSELTHKKLETALHGFELIDYTCSEGLYLEKDHPLIKTLQHIYKEITGDKSETFSIGGGTYARTLPCAVAFGPSFKHGASKGAHMHDECASLTELLNAARIYAHAFYELANL